MSAIEVRSGRLDWQIDQPQFFIDADLSPHSRVAVCRPRVLEPRVIPKLTWPRNRVERPQHLAGPDIERASLTLGVVVSDNGHAFLQRHPDNDNVLNDNRG